MEAHEDKTMSSIIIDRLGERQKKIDRMKEWDNRSSFISMSMHVAYIVAAIAACTFVIWKIVPPTYHDAEMLKDLGITCTPTGYRAASPDMAEIYGLIESKQIDEALVKTKKLLDRSDMVIYEYEGLDVYMNDEEMMYSMEVEKLTNSELRWIYIYLLVCTNKQRDAIKQLKIYLKQEENCEHKTEAHKLLNELKKKI